MARSLVAVALVVSLSLFGCSEDTPTSSAQPDIGFVVSTSSDYSCDTCVSVYVSSNRLLPVVPEVTVNGQAPDSSIGRWPDSWSFSGFHAFDTAVYRIAYDGDVITDTVVVPGPIDSLFCNDVYLQNASDTSLMWIPALDTAAVCRFWWKARNRASSYRIEYNGEGLTQDYAFTLVHDTVAVVPVDTSFDRVSGYAYFSFAICTREGNALIPGGQPDKVSGRLFAYYDLEGPRYQVNYQFGY